ncbi:FXL17 protein, partial [Chordeiles acutipennis]|nr:FXL17 protein [Chordeiles acutipennis]
MGHLLSKEASSLSRDRRCRRGRKVPPRSRSCFLRGPCMLCFIVHSASPPAPEQPLSARDSLLLPPAYAALATAEQRAARCLLRLPPAAWEPRGRCQRLLLSGLLPSPVRSLLGPSRPPGEVASEMVGTGDKEWGFSQFTIAALPDLKAQEQCVPTWASHGVTDLFGHSSQLWHGDIHGLQMGLWSSAPPHPPALGVHPCSGVEYLWGLNTVTPARGLSFLLQCGVLHGLHVCICSAIFSNLSLNERCLSASLVCKYWRDLCLDFQFWKQLDLSSRQQVTDELLEKIASRSQNITEINISDCRNVSDTGVCILAIKCPGLLRYTAYRCKQLSDTSIIAVASQCPLLQKVHVGNQDRLTDEGLKQLGSKCRELKDIHFGQCYKISDEGMIIIAKGCLKLQRIYMQENKLVTDQSVKAFAEHCPELQYVGFMGCSVTSKGVIHLTNVSIVTTFNLSSV